MKRKIINLMLVVLVLASCAKKTEVSNLDENEINKAVVTQVLNSKNGEEQKLMCRTLNSAEKSFAWDLKYETILNSNKFTNGQIGFIKKLKSTLNKEIFEKGNNPIKDKIQALEADYKKEAIELFGISGAYELMVSLSPESNLNYPPGQGNCDCSKKSDWCPSGHACLRVGCVIIASDCGWWWNYDCTGDCWIDV